MFGEKYSRHYGRGRRRGVENETFAG